MVNWLERKNACPSHLLFVIEGKIYRWRNTARKKFTKKGASKVSKGGWNKKHT
jgi:hypothetical protein